MSPKSIRQVPARRLWPGDSAKRKLQGESDVHAYEVQLEAGQVLQGKIVARGIDGLRVVLWGPKGKRLLDLESASGGLPPEPLVALAEASGGYRLEVKASQRGAYELSLDPARPAGAVDRRRAAAAFHLSNGLALYRGGDTGSWHLAATELRRALALWDPVADRHQRAMTLLWLGKALQGLDKQPDARSVYEEALSLLRAERDQAGEAYAVDLIGRTYYYQNDLKQALELYRRALALYRRASDLAGESDTLSNVAGIYSRRGRTQDALTYYDRSLALQRKLGRRGNQAVILSNIGQVELAMGRPSEALRFFQEALSLQHGVEREHAKEAITLSSMGTAYEMLGLIPEALDYLSRALEVMERLGDSSSEVTTLTWIGYLLAEAGQIEQAEARFDKALNIARRIDDIRMQAYALGNLAWVRDLQHREAEAVQLYDQARKLARAASDADTEARIVDGAARAWHDLGDFPAARELSTETLDLTESLRTGTASQGQRSSFAAQVRDRYLFAIGLLLQSHRREPAKRFDVQAFEVSERARARSLLDELAESNADLYSGVDPQLIETEARLLREIKKRENARQARPSESQDEGSRRQLSASDRELAGLVVQHDRIQAQIRAASPQYAALVQSRPLALAEIQREVLDNDSLLLSYVLAEPQSFLFFVSRNSLEAFALPGRQTIEAAVLELGRFLVKNRRRKTRGEWEAAARKLSDLLLAPAAGRLGAKRLLIVADGALSFVPFAVLTEPGSAEEAGRPLLVEHEIVLLPSASALALLRRERAHRRPAPHAVAVLADPVFGPGDQRLAPILEFRRSMAEEGVDAGLLALPPLPWSRREAEAILSLVPPEESFHALGFEADLKTATNPMLGQYRTVHFATHGLLNANPELSGLVFSQFDEWGNRKDGFLHALEIYSLDLPVELVVLSACETALGEDVRGEGVSRLTRGFLYAGAKGVVVSLWSVSDRATAELMTHFYRTMLRDGLSPAAALRKAQIAVRSRPGWEAPYYWAGFVLQGDWR